MQVVVIFSSYVRELQEGAEKEVTEVAMVRQEQAPEMAELGEGSDAVEEQSLLGHNRPRT